MMPRLGSPAPASLPRLRQSDAPVQPLVSEPAVNGQKELEASASASASSSSSGSGPWSGPGPGSAEDGQDRKPMLMHGSITTEDDWTCPSGRLPLPVPASAPAGPSLSASEHEAGPAGTASDVREGSIFVSICSFRDSECQHTIRDLFATATNPDR